MNDAAANRASTPSRLPQEDGLTQTWWIVSCLFADVTASPDMIEFLQQTLAGLQARVVARPDSKMQVITRVSAHNRADAIVRSRQVVSVIDQEPDRLDARRDPGHGMTASNAEHPVGAIDRETVLADIETARPHG